MESLLDYIKRVLARIFYTPRPFRNFELPEGYRIEPFWTDKGRVGFFSSQNSTGNVHLILYWYGKDYAEISQLLRKELETAGAKLLDLRDVHTAKTPMRLWVYTNPLASGNKLDVSLQSDYHRLYLSAGANTDSDIEAFLAFFSRL